MNLSNRQRNSRQISLATLFIAVTAIAVIFAYVTNTMTVYHISFPCTAFPRDDDDLATWYRKQDGVSDVFVSRDSDAVHVRYSKKQAFGSMDFPIAPVADLGYDANGFGAEISRTPFFAPAFTRILRQEQLAWVSIVIIIAIIVGMFMVSS